MKKKYSMMLETMKNMEMYGFSEEQARQAVVFYREYFTSKGILENYVYEGIEELLKSLVRSGKHLYVATSKPEPFAIKILEHFQLAKYFEYIAGATLEETRTSKDDVIKYLLDQCKFTDLSRVVMVGDRKHDIMGASKCSLDSIGVLYGYGSREELEKAGASYIADTVDSLERMLASLE